MAAVQHDIQEINRKLELKDYNLLQQQQLETQLEHLDRALLKCERLRLFRLETEQKLTVVKVHPSQFGGAQIQFTIAMTQFLLNLNDATTGHKLQGIPINNIVILAFPNKKHYAMFKTGNMLSCHVQEH